MKVSFVLTILLALLAVAVQAQNNWVLYACETDTDCTEDGYTCCDAVEETDNRKYLSRGRSDRA